MPTVEELEAMIKDYTWEDFEKVTRGEIKVSTKDKRWLPTKLVFKMRVGMYMRRPTQAIMADGKFVRTRAAPEFKDFELQRLDAKDPDAALYDGLETTEQK